MQAIVGRAVPWLTAGLVAICACGGSAVSFISQVAIERAEEQIESARVSAAEELAAYQYTKADLYVRMAKERYGFSDYQAAKRFAEDAGRFAQEATKAAKEARRLQHIHDEIKKGGTKSAPRLREGSR